MKNTKFLYIIIGLLVASQIYSTMQMNGLKHQIANAENNAINIDNRLNNQIREIYDNVDRKLSEYSSIVASCDYAIGEFNEATLTLPITFNLQLKTLTDTTKVFLEFDGDKVQLQRSDSKFSITKDFQLTAVEISPTIIIEDNGVEQFSKNDNLRIYSLVDIAMPRVALNFSGKTTYNAQPPYYYTMKGNISYYMSFGGANQYYKDGKYLVTLDDNVIKTYNIEDFENINLNINDKFEMEAGEKLVGKFTAKDKYGNLYEQILFSFIAGLSPEENQDMRFLEDWSITAPNGRLIYKYEENLG